MPKQRRFGSTEKHHFFSGSYLILGFFFVFYQIFSSIFPLPLLIGFFFNYMFVLLHESEQTLYELDFRWYFSLFYLVFIDITHDFYLFSSCFAFFAFYFIRRILARDEKRKLAPLGAAFGAAFFVYAFSKTLYFPRLKTQCF